VSFGNRDDSLGFITRGVFSPPEYLHTAQGVLPSGQRSVGQLVSKLSRIIIIKINLLKMIMPVILICVYKQFIHYLCFSQYRVTRQSWR
jgi:hypothetical protein